MKYLDISKPLTLNFLSTQVITVKDIPYLSARKFGEPMYKVTIIFTITLLLIFTFCLMYTFIIMPLIGHTDPQQSKLVDVLFNSIIFGMIAVFFLTAFSLLCFLYFFYSKHIHSIYIKEMITECDKTLEKKYSENIQKLRDQFIFLNMVIK